MNTQTLRCVATLALTCTLLLATACEQTRVQKTQSGVGKKPVVAQINKGKTTAAGDRQLPPVPSSAEQTGDVLPKKPEKNIDRGPPQTIPGSKVGQLAKNIFLENDGDKRRVLVLAEVCKRQGMLEQMLCKAMTKEHESILSAAVDAKDIHFALMAAGAEPGSPVKFEPHYTLDHGIVFKIAVQDKKPVLFGYSVFPAHGTVIKVSVQYEDNGQTVTVPAQKWLKNIKTEKELNQEWVFGGSFFYSDDPAKLNNPQRYAANDGNVISVSNFETSMLDLPVASSADEQFQDIEAWTERIPAAGTPVVVILEPVLPVNKK